MTSGYFKANRFYRAWLPKELPTKKAEKIIIIFHGLGEHSGRYENVAEFFNAQGYGVFAVDHIGHGKTEGKRGHVDKFENYTDNAREFIDFVEAETGVDEFILIGHSLGSVIAHVYSLMGDSRIKQLVLSSPGYEKLVPPNAVKAFLGKLLSKIAPELLMWNELEAKDVSRDPLVVKDYEDDELNHDRVSTRFFTSFLAAIEQIDQNPTVSMPVLYVVAGNDQLVNAQKSKKVFDGMQSEQKMYIQYPGLYHEIFNEKEQQTVFKDVLNWLQN